MDLKFFTVDEKYIQYLKKFDKNVPDNYSEEKPFIGILFTINDLNYIAPLSSAKPKHNQIKNSSPTTFKIHDGNSRGDLLAIVQLNNMIPVSKSQINKIDTNSLDIKYQFLLLKEINYIRAHHDKLIKKATKLYDMVTVKKIDAFVNCSCDFKALEAAAEKYS